MASLVLLALTHTVWDGVFSPSALGVIRDAGAQRAHSHTTVFDRGEQLEHEGRTLLEACMVSLLTETGDCSRFVEYWYRDEWLPMDAHRDVDETLARTLLVGDAGAQRCPIHGHVLYLDAEEGARGPTCVLEEEPSEATAAETDDAGSADLSMSRGGPPRPLRRMTVVPVVPGRLLRFGGDALHAVPRPTLEWISDVERNVKEFKTQFPEVFYLFTSLALRYHSPESPNKN